MQITQETIRKIHTLLDAGLVIGMGHPVPGQMCVEAAICYALGLPHSDDPQCVLPVLRSLKIKLNDQDWSSNKARAEGLRRLAIAQLGTETLDLVDFCKRLTRMTIQKVIPAAFREIAPILTGEHPKKLLAIAVKCEAEPTEAHAREAQTVAYAAVYAVYAATAAANAANAAANAANAAAYAANAAANAAAYSDAAKDRVLAEYAENVVQILIEMDAPGCKWL